MVLKVIHKYDSGPCYYFFFNAAKRFDSTSNSSSGGVADALAALPAVFTLPSFREPFSSLWVSVAARFGSLLADSS